MRRRLRARQRQRPPRRAPALRARRPRPTRARARRSQRFLNAARRRARSSSCAARPRPSTWWRQTYGRAHVKAGDEVLITAHGAPLEHRALADAVRGSAAPGCAWSPIDRRRRAARSTSSSGCSARARGSSPSPTSPTRSAPSTRCGDIAAHGARARRPACSSTARRPRRTCRSTCRRLGCDFYAFSGHKTLRPDGHRRALRARRALLEAMPPYQGGGDMIRSVTFEKTTYNVLPYKFEAGTPNIAGAIGLGAAIDYVDGARARARSPPTSTSCSRYATARAAASCPACASSAPRAEKAGVLSFVPRRRAPARRRHDPRPRGRRDPHRPPLRAAGDGALRRAGHRARLVRVLQHARGDRRAGRAACTRCGRCSRDVDLRELYQEVILDHNQRPRNFGALPEARPQRRGLQPALRRPGHAST